MLNSSKFSFEVTSRIHYLTMSICLTNLSWFVCIAWPKHGVDLIEAGVCLFEVLNMHKVLTLCLKSKVTLHFKQMVAMAIMKSCILSLGQV